MIQVEMSLSLEKSNDTTKTSSPGDRASGVSFDDNNTVLSIFLLKFWLLLLRCQQRVDLQEGWENIYICCTVFVCLFLSYIIFSLFRFYILWYHSSNQSLKLKMFQRTTNLFCLQWVLQCIHLENYLIRAIFSPLEFGLDGYSKQCWQ